MIQPGPAAQRLRGSQRAWLAQPPREDQPPIALDKGDPSFGTPEYICEAAIRAIRDGYTHYPPGPGYGDLRAAIATKLSSHTARPFNADEVFITSGGTGAIFAALAAFLAPGDQIVTLDPTYSIYVDVGRALDVDTVYVPLAAGFRVDLEALAAAITPQTRALVINSPNNPTGSVLTAAELDGMAALAERHDLLVVSDEVYDRILFDGRHHVSALDHPGLVERTVLVNSFSKSYAMTGWRIGYVAGRRDLVTATGTLHRTMVGGVSTPAQRAALAAITDPAEADWLTWMQGQYCSRRAALVQALASAGLPVDQAPEGSFYAFFRHGLDLASADVTGALADHGVLVRSGSEFGPSGEGYLRVTFTNDEAEIAEGVRRIGATLKALTRPELLA
ncbi:MAG: pyridoxal phosphate-dependent aminotransferase [Chloroflexi bacterium]|nr:pyridoxal phosphate-dependent aminotransferase [Chloroflexota bacterium]